MTPAQLSTLRVHQRRKPPSVAFQIARSILTLAIRLIHRLAVNSRTSGPSTLVVRIDIIDMHDDAGVCHIRGKWRIEMMLLGYPV